MTFKKGKIKRHNIVLLYEGRKDLNNIPRNGDTLMASCSHF